MARFLYTFIYYLILPLILARLYWRGRAAPAYRLRWRERLGWFKAPSFAQRPLWVHSVSVGETVAAALLVNRLLEEHPERPIVVTTMTPTGSERVKALFGDRVFHVYAPYDLPGPIKRFLRRLNPCALIIMETELWPNWVALCAKQGIQAMVANARLSERSARGYGKVSAITRPMLQELSWVAAQNAADGARFMDLGLPQEHLSVTGSIKFDISVSEELRGQSLALREAWGGSKRFVWVAGSTHEGEDAAILAAHQQLLAHRPDALLVIVPRHPERFDKVGEDILRAGLSMVRRSSNATVTPETQVLLGDTMGELLRFYAAADLAFVGGSLVDTGGHNPLEPAAVGKPVLMGPAVFNFTDICAQLAQAQGLRFVERGTLGDVLSALCDDEAARLRMGEAASTVVNDNRGALDRLLDGVLRRAPER
ncbi:3-deoxy-D-manno-octulosonic acid transferase [Hahella sp. KA22]|uniref:lipid IV(A) 3-deoxy-D-manno-octulosonic acid transferase n=1 Tax=Hahella sp. KA22 TaxID=1628392 RepID=UPI000FDE42C7|nr:lipid IV(A) 3-deoxy-D-manno-octulosonic acid transferase [Hahella sp. KA22]AZZ94422.1 3-deoxy-D-manno-octulosonic acid transferase [Hahella sp. KA22]QAY57796.1 3-deoxy-D-manno-octulosonic acid transferase [Hahella sp. KA22]